jgi:hypothetical protein
MFPVKKKKKKQIRPKRVAQNADSVPPISSPKGMRVILCTLRQRERERQGMEQRENMFILKEKIEPTFCKGK